MAIYLARHGATAWSETGQHTGRTDIPLLAAGETQAQRLGKRLADLRFSAVFTSPLQRAKRTAELAGFGKEAQTDEALLEVDYGRYEGLTGKQIQETQANWDFFLHGPAGGETLAQVGARVRAFLKRISDLEGDILLFSHGHLLRILTAVHLDQEPSWGGHLKLDTASLSILTRNRETPAISLWNSREHLNESR